MLEDVTITRACTKGVTPTKLDMIPCSAMDIPFVLKECGENIWRLHKFKFSKAVGTFLLIFGSEFNACGQYLRKKSHFADVWKAKRGYFILQWSIKRNKTETEILDFYVNLNVDRSNIETVQSNLQYQSKKEVWWRWVIFVSKMRTVPIYLR